MVDHQATPYCRPCGDFHDESTCSTFLQIFHDKMAERAELEQINMWAKIPYWHARLD